jgi:DNA ligase-1
MYISPMLLQTIDEPFNSQNHVAELKLDGFRLVVSNMDGLQLYTRHNNNVTSKFPELHNCPIPQGTILDGELIVTDQEGKPDFEAMQSRFQSKKDKTPVTFCAFDIIRHKGIDVTGLPLYRRKELLEESFEENDYYKKVKSIQGNAVDYFGIVEQHGLEGIVIKKANSRYEANKRSWSWVKVINWTYADAYISGYRKGEFGLLVSVPTKDGIMSPVGVVEFGVTPKQKRAFNSIKTRLVYKDDVNYAYMEPLLKVKVKTRNWTKRGMLRSPVFVDFVL